MAFYGSYSDEDELAYKQQLIGFRCLLCERRNVYRTGVHYCFPCENWIEKRKGSMLIDFLKTLLERQDESKEIE